MSADGGRDFSLAMTRFLEQQCVIGASYSVADEHLFTRFKAFWKQAPARERDNQGYEEEIARTQAG